MIDETKMNGDENSSENNNSAQDKEAFDFEPSNDEQFEAITSSSSNEDAFEEDLSNETPLHAEFEETNVLPETSEFAGGTAYTKNVEGEISEGYEWNSYGNPENDDKKTKKKKEKSSGRGFRIFIGTVLTVFTLSIVVLTAFVARYFAAAKLQLIDAAEELIDDFEEDITTSDRYNYPGIIPNNDHYVPYDFADEEGKVLSIPQVAAKCSPSSVGIISEVEVTYSYPFYFSPSTRIAEASGSGFIYGTDGYIITNHHVIENAKTIRVVLYNGTEYEAELVGSDALSDLAVLKIEPGEDEVLIPMEIGDSSNVVVGEPVVAIGCPAGIEFIGTVTDGIVSAINRDVKITDSYGNVQKTMTLIQTNATINHGNSGGPLINTKGEVIGINTLKLAQNYEGVGFSIPINGALPVIKQLIDHGEVVNREETDYVASKGMIGINGSEISESEAEYYDIPRGVLVIQINKDSSAAKAGLRRGDIITHYNGVEVHTIDEINAQKGSAMAGEEATLTIYRENYTNDTTFDITFKLDPQE